MEIVNRPMAVELDSSIAALVTDNEYEELYDLCEHVNSSVLGMSIEELKRVSRRIGVAGGLHKYFAIRQAIRKELITDLITDRETARLLVAHGKSA